MGNEGDCWGNKVRPGKTQSALDTGCLMDFLGSTEVYTFYPVPTGALWFPNFKAQTVAAADWPASSSQESITIEGHVFSLDTLLPLTFASPHGSRACCMSPCPNSHGPGPDERRGHSKGLIKAWFGGEKCFKTLFLWGWVPGVVYDSDVNLSSLKMMGQLWIEVGQVPD